jgi:hypothetical protein
MKPGCVVYTPEGKSWCVLVESRKPDGTVARFMSFHKTLHDARLTQNAHADVNEGDPDVKIHIFKYEFIASDEQLAEMMIQQALEAMVNSWEKELSNDCND